MTASEISIVLSECETFAETILDIHLGSAFLFVFLKAQRDLQIIGYLATSNYLNDFILLPWETS